MDEYPYPITVDVSWTNSVSKGIQNKLQIYFQSKKKSSGGDCLVHYEDQHSTRATVYFKSEDVRERVLSRDNHEMTVDNETVKLRLSSSSGENLKEACSPSLGATSNELSGVSGEAQEAPNSESLPGEEGGAEVSPQSSAVVLERVPESMSRDLLLLLVETLSGLEEDNFSLEVISETNRAVVTFNNPNDVERFLTESKSNKSFQKQGLIGRLLERCQSVRVENLTPNIPEDMLELYFEKWAGPAKDIFMFHEEQAAIVTFHAAEVVETTLNKHHVIGKVPVNVYPYYESLGTALYGKERPMWKMPDPFIECVHSAVWKFLSMKRQLSPITDQMKAHFCQVNMDTPEVKLSPLPTLLRQKGLTSKDVDGWKQNALIVFRDILAKVAVFECFASAPAWKAVEKEVRSVVKEDAVLAMDASKGSLTVAGLAEDTKRLRGLVEDLMQRAMSRIERQRDGISEELDVSPAMFYILQQEGLRKHAADEVPEMGFSYRDDTKKLVLSGLVAEVYKVKNWILERELKMNKKQLKLDPYLLDFLLSVDSMEMSQDLFTSRGINAVYRVEGGEVLLTGSSDRALADAEQRLKTALSLQSLMVEDQEVLRKPEWKDLNDQLVDAYNSLKKRTVVIKLHPESRDRITVSGFLDPVREVSNSLRDFVENYSRVKEAVRVKSCAVVKFIQENKSQDWKHFAKHDEVNVHFDPRRPKIVLSGARLYVKKVKENFQKMVAAFCTDELTIMKPGARKYFQEKGRMFISMAMKEYGCVVLLQEDYMLEEEEGNDEDEEEAFGPSSCCEVRTPNGILVSVSKADICKFKVDAVVNAANEDLQHIGGLALALLKAAGPRLQELSDQHVRNNRRLQPGDAIVTDAGNLPCKYVVHAVGPRFTDFDQRTAIQRLKQAVNESLREAAKVNCSTVAIPAVSSGIFGFPLNLCTETIAVAVRDYCENLRGQTSLTEIHLVDNSDNTVRALASAVQKTFNDLHPKMTMPLQGAHRGSGQRGSGQRGRGQHSYRHQGPEYQGKSTRGHRQWEHGDGGEGRGGGEGGGRGRGGGRGGHGDRGGGVRESGTQRTYHENREEQRREYGQERKFEGVGSGEILQTNRTQEGLKIILRKGNIQEEYSEGIVNTISEDLDLSKGAVSNAILKAAGPGLQSAATDEARAIRLAYGDVVVTDGYNLRCQRVIHTVCPHWDQGAGSAEKILITMIRDCLSEAEKHRLASLSFPAIGTGNMGFPKGLVSKLLLQEVKDFSQRRNSTHLKEVAIVVHPSDTQTVDCFIREFKGQTQGYTWQSSQGAGQSHHPKSYVDQSQHAISYVGQSQQPSGAGFFGQVSSPSLGVYSMQMGHITFEVSSGDITKETSDVIVNSSNKDFNLKSGVSKSILEGAGLKVESECSEIVKSPSFQPCRMIVTSAGSLPCKHIMHIVGQNDPEIIKETVYNVLKKCEERKFTSVSFPALGTGQGGASPSAVADAMIDAVVDFVKRKKGQFVRSVKILIFQTAMVTEFHKSMKRRVGEEVEEKGLFTRLKDTVTTYFMGPSDERSARENFVMEGEEFAPTVFQLCAESPQDVSRARDWVKNLIVKEQTEKTIKNPYISQLSQGDVEKLQAMQRELTVRICLEKKGPDSLIRLEGLSRDVLTADSLISNMVLDQERAENRRQAAFLVSSLVEWQYKDHSGTMVSFDMFTNYILEEAVRDNSKVTIKINNDDYKANVAHKRAVKIGGRREIELLRKDLKDDTSVSLPAHWDDMKGSLLMLVPLTPGSKEYKDVEKKFQKTLLTDTIITIERVQNHSLWKSYQIRKNLLEEKNKHTNNEKLLFHGTSSNSITQINSHGFNRSYAGTHGAAIGNGSYFAVDSSYSAGGYSKADAQGNKRMYLARVLVGDYTLGKAGLIVPPAKPLGKDADLYDSVTDNTSNPTMFVIFSDVQAYPEFLITFQ
ncbi:protein mono-ADP-ribosyltransferase PARP14-like [Salvelinus fontinalis]|uniref:protein mono-ADP-ribosyltransferase PARP14-like n=1 Tax=Salvelinus fontinalis TaxID=8038 RepID=UPI0024854C55|nr:protein mono-ADP-ribosyltransferase PARP14-like [Salvelinus fontinalis]